MTSKVNEPRAAVFEADGGWVWSDGRVPSFPQGVPEWAVEAALDAGAAVVLVETRADRVDAAEAWARAGASWR